LAPLAARIVSESRRREGTMSHETGNLTRAELGKALREQGGFDARGADALVSTFVDTIVAALTAGERVELRGLGSFSVGQRGPRMGRNPKTGAAVPVPAKRVVRFRAGKGVAGSDRD
jgi:integration host factor subunit beta